MKRTIILGNGFDLDIGFPTAYKHYIASSEFKSNLWGVIPQKYGMNSHPSNLFKYIQIKAVEEHRWTDIERILSDYASKGEIIISTKSGQMPVRNVSTQEIGNYYEHLKDSLKRYIAGIKFQELTNRSSLAYNLLKAISGNGDPDLSVLSYNYTLPARIFPELNLDGKITNVHGSIESEIILGFNDSGAYDSSYSYMVKSKEFGIQIENVRSKIRGSDELLIYGHSLGESDRDYFKDTLPCYQNRVIFVTRDSASRQEICNELTAMNAYNVINAAEWYYTSEGSRIILF